MTIELFTHPTLTTRNRHFFRIRARNGRVIAQSEGYVRKESAESTAKLFVDSCAQGKVKIKHVAQ